MVADSAGSHTHTHAHMHTHTRVHTRMHARAHTHTCVHTHAPISEQGAMQFDPKAERCYQRCLQRWAGPLWSDSRAIMVMKVRTGLVPRASLLCIRLRILVFLSNP